MSWEQDWHATRTPRELAAAFADIALNKPLPEIRAPKTKAVVDRFGGALRAARESRNMNMAEVAKSANISPSTMSRLEGGSRVPSFELLTTIVAALDLTIEERSHLFAAAGYLPDDLTGIVDSLAVETNRLLVSLRGTDRERDVRAALRLILKGAA